MSKDKNGKEVKKPKKAHAPNPPGLPASLAALTPAGRPKKK